VRNNEADGASQIADSRRRSKPGASDKVIRIGLADSINRLLAYSPALTAVHSLVLDDPASAIR
jgi:hypothetical protein